MLKYGGKKNTIIICTLLQTCSIPPRLLEALNKYVCLMRPLRNLTMTKKNSNTILVAQKFEALEKCIFVPRDVAESQQCGGLRLVKNIKNVVRDPNFCNKEFGKYS